MDMNELVKMMDDRFQRAESKIDELYATVKQQQEQIGCLLIVNRTALGLYAGPIEDLPPVEFENSGCCTCGCEECSDPKTERIAPGQANIQWP